MIRKLVRIGISLVVLVAGVIAVLRFVIDYQNEPLCHKVLYNEVATYLWDNEKSGDLPNVEGRSAESISRLSNSPKEWNSKYRYVPGLRRGDPGDLVLMYMKQPTRYIWHGNPQTIFREARWMIVPLDFAGSQGWPTVTIVNRAMPYTGEQSERLTIEEFENRLRKTLNFLRENDRPHWKTVVAEHEEFLKSLETQ